ncbi:MAG: methyltransferase domain-containing protein [Bacteroidales bacterium]
MEVFDNVKGYAYDQPINDSLEKKAIQTLEIIYENGKSKFENILIAGCGKGEEASVFYKLTKANVTGVDLNAIPIIKTEDGRRFQIKIESLDDLSFTDEEFDLIYCYHVLEHVNDPEKVLLELKRVLSKDGIIFIGFPNRLRMLPGYLSTHLNISLIEVIKFNLNDYKMRFTGKFKNKYGAHAGFSEKEFLKMAKPIFSNTLSVRKIWIDKNYTKFGFLFKIINKLMLADFFYPSNYYIIKK